MTVFLLEKNYHMSSKVHMDTIGPRQLKNIADVFVVVVAVIVGVVVVVVTVVPFVARVMGSAHDSF